MKNFEDIDEEVFKCEKCRESNLRAKFLVRALFRKIEQIKGWEKIWKEAYAEEVRPKFKLIDWFTK